ncbi:hypothetical protein BH11BAC3_BH11BAC3_42090 [soil metagenome]
MLAKETDNPFDDKDWIFEIKWDGYRAIAEVNKNNTELYSRNGNSFNNTYPLIFNALKKLNLNVVFDGEIVVLNEAGRSDFQKLQHYEDNTNFPLCYYVFDILAINGQPTYDIPLLERKALLREAFKDSDEIRYSEHIAMRGEDFFKAAVNQNLEGIMGKEASSLYYPGKRTNNWLKIKHHKIAEVVIVGYTAPAGSRKFFGSLVLAVKGEEGLQYAGHTGSGFDEKGLQDVYNILQPLVVKKSPFREVVKTNGPVTWVKPILIAEIKFTEWTTDHKMRHPIFLRLRADKNLETINMETTPTKLKKAIEKPTADTKEKEISFGKIKVKTTNLTKVFWPKEKITKGMVIDYYQQVASYILPYLKDRPQSLKRNPNGITDKGFYHKDAGDDAPSWVNSKKIYSESTKKDIDYIICNDKQTLAYLNNLGCIELNPWNSRIQSMDKPDYMIIDIDPSDKNTFSQVVEAALVCKEILDKAKAACYCKTSGATGLHIFIPMGKKYSYEQVKDFAHIVCTMAAEMLPDSTTLERSLSKRSDKKIYLDYLQNRRGQTVASVYSLRPHPGASISTPLDWKEVKEGLDPAAFNLNTIFERIKNKGDVFKPVLGKGVNLNKCLENLGG